MMDGMQLDSGRSAHARGFFAGFTFKADQDLRALASFYGLALPAIEPVSLGDYLRRTYHGIPQPGYRVAVGYAELCVLEVEQGAITKVGLRPLPFPISRIRHNPGRYQVGGTLIHPAPVSKSTPARRTLPAH